MGPSTTKGLVYVAGRKEGRSALPTRAGDLRLPGNREWETRFRVSLKATTLCVAVKSQCGPSQETPNAWDCIVLYSYAMPETTLLVCVLREGQM